MLRNLNILKGIFLATTTLAVALGLMPPNTALAQWTNDPWNGMVNVCNASGNQETPLIGRFEDSNRTLIVWMDSRVSGQLRSYYQVLSATGIPLLENNGLPVCENTSWSVQVVGVLPDLDGGIIAVSGDNRDGAWDLYGQRFDSLGNKLWGETGLPLVIWPGQQEVYAKDLAADSLGNFFVAWDVYVSYYNTDTYIQKFNVAGQRLWGDYGVPAANNSADQGSPQIVADNQGGVLDVWQQGPEPDHFYFQHLDPDGNPWPGLPANGILLHDISGQPMAASLWEGVTDGEGGGVWCNWGAGGPNNFLYLFRLNGDGRTQWVWTNYSYCEHWFDNLHYHPADGSLWLDVYENPGGVWSSNLYRFDHNGEPQFTSVSVPYGGDSMTPTSDGVITARVLEVAQNTRFLAQRTDSTGALLWTSEIALGGLFQGAPVFGNCSAVPDNHDGIVIAFEDYRQILSTGYNLSAQRVLSDGQLGNPQFNPHKPDLPSSKLDITGDLITFTLPKAGDVWLELYDLLGRKVATLLDHFQPAGEIITTLPTAGLPSGLYFLHLKAPNHQQTVKVVLTK